MAISDMCTGLCPLPLYIYFYSYGNYVEKIPINWCVVYFYFDQYFPTIFHTISIWLTTTLTIQRYIHVLLTNFFLLLTFPVNFFIYCGMSKKFRETFKKTINCYLD
ncbi:sex peptide receptor-like [Mytilus galloprovincialis]|uniref:sex peptide receptor-like n=1 Tax=Mytilus galloprovincialis TaxID=29158 RepID=UPI003F7B60BB